MGSGVAGQLQTADEEVLLSFRILQFPGEGTTRVLRMRALPEHWSTPSGYSPEIGFLQAWFEDDSPRSGNQSQDRINWGAVSGLALSVLLSVSFWTGVGVLIARLVR